MPPVLLVAGFVLINFKYLAAPKLTNSYSLNEKLYRAPHQPLEMMAIGSSMTQCNLHSETLIQQTGCDRFFNLASWGFRIADIDQFIDPLIRFYRPSECIIVSNVMDFESSGLVYNTDPVEDYLRFPLRGLYRFAYPDLDYLISKTSENRETKTRLNIYSSLCYDQWGGVPLSTNGFVVSEYRWNHTVSFSAIDPAAYEKLESICRRLKASGVRPVFVLSPLRNGLVDAQYRGNIKIHANRVRRIIELSGGLFVDATKVGWPDSLFVDGTHLHAEGGKQLSTMVADALAASPEAP